MDTFYGHLEYFTGIWDILWQFGNLVTIWDIFPCFGALCQEKSGNPASQRKDFLTFYFVYILRAFVAGLPDLS
jgi:hypothetical protein